MLPPLALLLALASPALQGERAELRTLPLTVTDEKGSPLQGLIASEVAVLENGAARELRSLELDTRPLTVAILVDSSEPLATFFRLHLVEAVTQFVARLPPATRYAVWTTGDRPQKIVDYTDDPALAATALKKVFPRGGNTLLDAFMEASRDLKAQEGTRGAMVALTGSGLGFSNYDRRQVVEAFEKQTVTVLSVQIDEGRTPFRAAGDPGEEIGQVGAVDYDYVLGALARATGGLRETILSPMGAAVAMQKLTAELKGQYRLTYATAPGLKERKLEVKVARPGVKVRVGTPRP